MSTLGRRKRGSNFWLATVYPLTPTTTHIKLFEGFYFFGISLGGWPAFLRRFLFILRDLFISWEFFFPYLTTTTTTTYYYYCYYYLLSTSYTAYVPYLAYTFAFCFFYYFFYFYFYFCFFCFFCFCFYFCFYTASASIPLLFLHTILYYTLLLACDDNRTRLPLTTTRYTTTTAPQRLDSVLTFETFLSNHPSPTTNGAYGLPSFDLPYIASCLVPLPLLPSPLTILLLLYTDIYFKS
jgi:hypothetical protein